MKGRILTYPLLLMMVFSARAQDIMGSVKCANQFYEQAATLKLRMEYRMYEGWTDEVPTQVSTGEYLKSGPRSYSKINGLITVVSEKVAVTVDPNTRTLSVAGAGTATFNPWGEVTEEKLKKVFHIIESLGTVHGAQGYRLTPDGDLGNEIARLEIWFDTERCYLTRLSMYFNEVELPAFEDGRSVKQRPRVDVVYTEVNWKHRPDPGIFSTDQYIRWDGENPRPTRTYKDYAFINSLRP